MQKKSKILNSTLFLLMASFCSNLFGQNQISNLSHKSYEEVGININEYPQDIAMINMYIAFLLIAGCLLGYKYKDKYFKE